jgi:cobalamin synthase
VAGVLGVVAVLLVVEAAVFALASFGLALHWSCLLVAAVLAASGAAAFYHGRSVTRRASAQTGRKANHTRHQDSQGAADMRLAPGHSPVQPRGPASAGSGMLPDDAQRKLILESSLAWSFRPG